MTQQQPQHHSPTIVDAAIQVAAFAHSGQRRKYTGEPYITHPVEVVRILAQHGITDHVVLAAGALHDVLEDCPGFDVVHLRFELFRRSGSSDADVYRVTDLVEELTDKYTHKAFPYLNRAQRKAAERVRLSQISADAQTIKYADMISNTQSIVKYDPNFAKVYLREKWALLRVMGRGDEQLWCEAVDLCDVEMQSLGIEEDFA